MFTFDYSKSSLILCRCLLEWQKEILRLSIEIIERFEKKNFKIFKIPAGYQDLNYRKNKVARDHHAGTPR